MFVKVIASQSNIVFRHGVDLFMLHVIFWAEKKSNQDNNGGYCKQCRRLKAEMRTQQLVSKRSGCRGNVSQLQETTTAACRTV